MRKIASLLLAFAAVAASQPINPAAVNLRGTSISNGKEVRFPKVSEDTSGIGSICTTAAMATSRAHNKQDLPPVDFKSVENDKARQSDKQNDNASGISPMPPMPLMQPMAPMARMAPMAPMPPMNAPPGSSVQQQSSSSSSSTTGNGATSTSSSSSTTTGADGTATSSLLCTNEKCVACKNGKCKPVDPKTDTDAAALTTNAPAGSQVQMTCNEDGECVTVTTETAADGTTKTTTTTTTTSTKKKKPTAESKADAAGEGK